MVGSAAWQPQVPAATVGRPALAGAVVSRTEVVGTLRSCHSGDLVLVQAPAGYGKTTAVALWDDEDERDFAWVRLDEYLDNDPEHLLLHIATAVAGVCGMNSEVLQFLRGPGRAPITQLTPALLEALEGRPVVIVLDDAHLVSSAPANAVLEVLIDDAPPTTTMVLVGRHAGGMNLARRRLQRRVIEIGTADLRLSNPEGVAMFTAFGGTVTDDTVRAVVEKCEGWPVGVHLAALALRNGTDASQLTGRHELVADYLVEEVLSRVDDSTVAFLEESSVLDRMNAADLDIVLCRDDSARMLATIAQRASLLLVALDSERVWYRYHHLLGDVLRARLCDRDPAQFRLLAARCADLLERQGDTDGALRQALAAGDRFRAAALVQRDAVRLGLDGRVGVLARRLAQLDEQTFTDCPDAAIARAWFGVTTGNAELIQRSLVAAHRTYSDKPLADGTPSTAVAAAFIASLIGVGGVLDTVRQADIVCNAGDYLVNPWWGAATTIKGGALSMMGEAVVARRLLDSALPAIEDLPGCRAAALAHLAILDLDDGDGAAAVERSSVARRIVDAHDLCDVVPMIVVYAVDALIRARAGDVRAARNAVAATERLIDRLGQLAARTALLGHVLMVATAVALDDNELLERHLRAADRARVREPDAAGLIRRLDQARRLWASRTDVGSRPALTSAELRLLPYLATHLSLQRIADELMVGRETAKTQATSIYRKLAVSSRAAAVSEAQRLGILDSPTASVGVSPPKDFTQIGG